MSWKYLITACCLIIASCTNSPKELNEFESLNPLPVEFGDPYVLLASDGNYYMYGTGIVQDGFGVYRSTNLKDWSYEGQVYHGNTDSSWNVANFWAPEVYEINDRFYMFFSADWRYNPTNELENFRIGVAVSDQPTGPFKDVSDKPLFDPGYPVIDANLYFEDDKIYLYYSRCCYKHPVESEISSWARDQNMFDEIEESWVYGVELSPDLDTIVSDPVLLLRPPVTIENDSFSWESRSVTSGEINRRWTEGSFLFKHDTTYYMMYSANYFGGEHYAVGYATASHPMGPFEKAPNNPILQKNTDNGGVVSGTGHNSVAWSEDGSHMYCVYHGRTTKTGEKRVVFIDQMTINDDGTLVVMGPTVMENDK